MNNDKVITGTRGSFLFNESNGKFEKQEDSKLVKQVTVTKEIKLYTGLYL